MESTGLQDSTRRSGEPNDSQEPDVGKQRHAGKVEAGVAIQGIAGPWWGRKGESYTIHEKTWCCERLMDDERKAFRLDWDPVHGVILWGLGYFFDPRDLAVNMRSISWYRMTDPWKASKIFSWVRSSDSSLKYQNAKGDHHRPQKALTSLAEQQRAELERKCWEQKRAAELEAQRRGTEESRKKAEQAREEERKRQEQHAGEEMRKKEEAFLLRVEEQRRMQAELARKRVETEEKVRQQALQAKHDKLAALQAASARASATLHKKDKKGADDGATQRKVAPMPPEPGAEGGAAKRTSKEWLKSRAPKEPDARPSLTLFLGGSLDSDTMQLFGNLMFLCGAWDKRTLDRFQLEESGEARRWSRTSRRATRRGFFTTAARNFVLLEPPEPSVDASPAAAVAAQAAAAVLTVSARRSVDLEAGGGEPDAGQQRLWQQALLLRAFRIEQVIVGVANMDHREVAWAPERFEEVRDRTAVLLRLAGLPEPYSVPLGNLTRSFIRDRHAEGAWYFGKTLLEYLDQLALPVACIDGPARFLPLEASVDRDPVEVVGSLVQGVMQAGQQCIVVARQEECTVQAVLSGDEDREQLTFAAAGRVVALRLSGPPSRATMRPGEVLCTAEPARCVDKFRASLQVVESSESGAICVGFKAMLLAHGARLECELRRIIEAVDLDTRARQVAPEAIKPNTFAVCTFSVRQPLPLATFMDCSGMGCFALQVGSQVVAIGKVIQLPRSAR